MFHLRFKKRLLCNYEVFGKAVLEDSGLLVLADVV